jgi:hypothetical protein
MLEPAEVDALTLKDIVNYWPFTTQTQDTKLVSATTLLLESDVSHFKCLVLYDSDAPMIF